MKREAKQLPTDRDSQWPQLSKPEPLHLANALAPGQHQLVHQPNSQTPIHGYMHLQQLAACQLPS